MCFMVAFGVWLPEHLSCHEKAGSFTQFLLIFSFLLPVLLSSPFALPLLLCIGAVAHQLWSCLACWTNRKWSIISFFGRKHGGVGSFSARSGSCVGFHHHLMNWYSIYNIGMWPEMGVWKIWVCEMGPSLFDSGEPLDQFTLSCATLSSDVVDFFPWKCVYHRGVSLICARLSFEQKVRSAFAIYGICKEKTVALRDVTGTNLHGEGNRAPSRRTVIRVWSSFALGWGH